MVESNYERFKKTFEFAHGQQGNSPFSELLTGKINYSAINCYLSHWKKSTDDVALLEKLHHWLVVDVDPERIENSSKIPDSYLNDLRELGCLQAKIPKKYGGLGLSQCQYSMLLEKLGSRSEVLALIVSVQQLGVAQGLLSLQKLERNQRQQQQDEVLRKKYLKQLATHALGAFCLTTPETGSDPSGLQTIARVSADGNHFEISGDWSAGGKLFTTLGTIADIYIMLAVVVYPGEDINNVDPRKRITAFIVERAYAGITVKPLSFCGWHGLPNAAIKLNKVKIPKENIVGAVGDGLKIAFMNLGSGRINISSISLGMMKHLGRVARWWGVERVQGGKPIGEHELNTDQLVNMNATIYACESFLQFVSAFADHTDVDIRLEAAMLKLFSSHALVDIADETLQLRGGRGYESYASQASRGDTAVAVERLFRSARMMKIGEGGSNVLKLYIMRCLLNDFLKDYEKIADQSLSLISRFFSLVKIMGQYAKGYLLTTRSPEQNRLSPLYLHMRYVPKAQQGLIRLLMLKVMTQYLIYYQIIIVSYFQKHPRQDITKPRVRIEQQQVVLGYSAEIAMLLSVMTVTCQRAVQDGSPHSLALADEFCIRARDQIALYVIKIKKHRPARSSAISELGTKIMQGDYADLLEQNVVRENLPNIRD